MISTATPQTKFHHDPMSGDSSSDGWLNRFDPFEGVVTDPQSLHKYTYAHNDPANNTDPSGLFSLSSQLSTTGIQATIQQGIGTISTIVRAYNATQRFLDVLDYARTVIGLLGALAQPTPQAAAAALVSELKSRFAVPDLNDIVNGFNQAIQSIAGDWDDISKNISAKAQQIAQEASFEGLQRLPTYARLQTQGRLKLVFFAPSGPVGKNQNTYIPVGDEIQVGVSPGGGRLFGFGIRTSKSHVDTLFRIDYWDRRSQAEGRPTPTPLHVHYHIPLKDGGDKHPAGRTIWP